MALKVMSFRDVKVCSRCGLKLSAEDLKLQKLINSKQLICYWCFLEEQDKKRIKT